MKASSPPDRLTKLLATVFFLSGLASLVYQVAWQRMLTLHYGVGSVSIAVIVTIYMFGLGLGRWWAASWPNGSSVGCCSTS